MSLFVYEKGVSLNMLVYRFHRSRKLSGRWLDFMTRRSMRLLLFKVAGHDDDEEYNSAHSINISSALTKM